MELDAQMEHDNMSKLSNKWSMNSFFEIQNKRIWLSLSILLFQNDSMKSNVMIYLSGFHEFMSSSYGVPILDCVFLGLHLWMSFF